MKKIITIAPLQKVKEGIYNAVNNEKLQYNIQVCFPVLPLIHGYVESGETVEVFVLTTKKHDISLANYREIKGEVTSLCEHIGASCTVRKIGIAFDETVEAHLDTFKKLIRKISDGDTILVDTTYGSKCLAIILMLAMNYGYRACKDCTIECYVYGSLDFRKDHPCGQRIYDITSLFLMDQIVNELSKNKNKNIMKVIENILNVNTSMKNEE